jgi:hypothetical protein
MRMRKLVIVVLAVGVIGLGAGCVTNPDGSVSIDPAANPAGTYLATFAVSPLLVLAFFLSPFIYASQVFG